MVFCRKGVFGETFRKKVDSSYRIFKTNESLRKEPALQKKFDEIYFEIDWLVKEYRSCISEDYGLFTWKKMPGYDSSRPFFRLESELKIKKLQECVQKFSHWETSFNSAFGNLVREFPSKKPYE